MPELPSLPSYLPKGANAPLPTAVLRAVLTWRSGPGVPDVDVSVLVLDAAGRVRGDADLVFFNQPRHPSGAVEYRGKTVSGAVVTDTVVLDLAAVPGDVAALVVAGSVDGSVAGGTFGSVPGLRLEAGDVRGGGPVVAFAVPEAGPETAFVFAEVYRRDGGWRFRAVGQGYASGLAGLATDFGVEVAADEAEPPQALSPVSPRVSLDQRLADAGHHELLALTRKAAVSLDKHGLAGHSARVALVLDMSASMSELYGTGRVQALAERALALALRFDDDGVAEVFAFASLAEYAGGLSLDNYRGRVAVLRRESDVGGGTDYSEAMDAVRRHYFGTGPGKGSGKGRGGVEGPPVFVMFVTDGATSERDAVREQVRDSSREPVFWQFMALGDAEDFAFVEELHRLPGRASDNTASFTVERLDALSDDALYALLTAAYPRWLAQARARGIVGGG
ncbi:MAG: stress response protein [Streptomycetaceae bacterium]|nr:stress response protein [Streptomycetaceae bacterium]